MHMLQGPCPGRAGGATTCSPEPVSEGACVSAKRMQPSEHMQCASRRARVGTRALSNARLGCCAARSGTLCGARAAQGWCFASVRHWQGVSGTGLRGRAGAVCEPGVVSGCVQCVVLRAGVAARARAAAGSLSFVRVVEQEWRPWLPTEQQRAVKRGAKTVWPYAWTAAAAEKKV